MAILPEYQQLAKELGVTRKPDQSEKDFMRWLDNMREHRKLLQRARRIGTPITSGMTSKELRAAFIARLPEALKEHGMVVDARVQLPGREVEIREIRDTSGREPKMIVQYWIVSPWIKQNNQGRSNFMDAEKFLEKGEPIP